MKANKLVLSIIFGMFLINLISAGIYENCEIYGNCKPVTSITTGANYTINVNNSDYLRGYSPTTLRSWMESYFNGIYVQLTELTNLVGNWSLDKPNYYTKTEINNSYVPYLGTNQNVDLGNNNLTINGTTLYVDTNNSRVGVGTTNPTTPLQVLGKINSITSVSRGTSVEFVGQDPNDLAA
ncbi:MAG: hypothetical protein M0R17_11025, partial [Candidatus Omnitrophica bacterium]|nr:hypothetical protein [Candidatus Omnitrophota bacterium]